MIVVKRPVWEMDLLPLPTALTLASTHQTDQACYSASYRKDGHLLLGLNNGVGRLLPDGTVKRLIDDAPGTCVPVATSQRVNYLISYNGSRYVVETCLSDWTQRDKLFDFVDTSNLLSFIAVSDRYVAVTKAGSRPLLLYDFTTTMTRVIRTNSPLWVVHFLPDGHLLATVRNQGDVNFLTKYQISGGKLILVWTCKNLLYGRGISTDSNGLIYVCSWKNRKLYIVSPDGE